MSNIANDSDACLSVEHSLRFGGKTRIDGQSLAGSINYERGGFAGGRNTIKCSTRPWFFLGSALLDRIPWGSIEWFDPLLNEYYTTTTTGSPAAVERVPRPRPKRNGTMVVDDVRARLSITPKEI